MWKLKDFLKKKEIVVLTELSNDDESTIKEVEQIIDVIEDEVDSLDERQYAVIHLNALINYIEKTSSPLKWRIIRDLKNIEELL